MSHRYKGFDPRYAFTMLLFAAIVSMVSAYSGYIEKNAHNNEFVPYAVFGENTSYIGAHAFCNTTLRVAIFNGTIADIDQHAFDDDSIVICVQCPNYVASSVTNSSCSVADVYSRLSKCDDAIYDDYTEACYV